MSRLTLSRKEHEAVLVFDGRGEQVARITVSRLRHNEVRLTFDADPVVLILREEVHFDGPATKKGGN